ncbi:amidohydrolase family protein [Inquilinus sp. OTU3971]|uniref:amidohydrolase family protein n=1 Tax=Inquilinus sp. OTU3971 TaxID=3043855 RepID=UPI00313CAF75
MTAASRPGLHRRDALLGIGSAALLASLGCRRLDPVERLPVIPDTAYAIDVHCHVFNARDLPIASFVLDVVLEGKPLSGLPLVPLVTLVSLVMNRSAWSPQRELRELERGRTPADDDLIQADIERAAAELLANTREAAAFRQKAVELLSGDGARLATAESLGDGDVRLLDLLARRDPSRAARPEGLPLRDRAGALPADAARGVTAVEDEVTGVFRLAKLVTRPRTELLRRLITLPARNDGDVALLVPALIDYSKWLNEESSSLRDQIDVMSAIARRPGPYAVHPYVPFCPWRQMEEPGHLAMVKDAVGQRGFIGVKLYPVMGFLPYGNAEANPDAYPPRLRQTGPDWAARLDQGLAALYDWCIAEDVPVMAHCSYSQFPNPAAGKCGSPEAWRPVLDRWPGLRLNLGHFGGFWNLAEGEPNGWTGTIIGMMKTYPTLYADLSDFDAVAEQTADQKTTNEAVLRALNAVLDLQGGPARSRLMYGTDWVMLSRAPGTEDYYEGMRTGLTSRLHMSATQAAGFMGMNAARFLGIALENGGKPKSRQRLEAFHARHGGVPASFWTRWDGAAAFA